MSNRNIPMLKVIHRRVGLLVQTGNRLLASVVVLGIMFGLLSVYSLQLLQHPEQVLRLQSFMFNYSEFSQVERNALSSGQAHALKVEKKSHDPNWDGAIAGASLGLAVGRDLPVIGLFVGPVVGATIGYELDSRI